MTDTMTADVFDRMTADDRWAGFGYLGGRRNALDGSDPEAPAQPVRVAAVDALVLAAAAERGWDYERLFEWANSKNGRWLADAMFGGPDGTAGLDTAWAAREIHDSLGTTR